MHPPMMHPQGRQVRPATVHHLDVWHACLQPSALCVQVKVLVGEPIDVSDLLRASAQQEWSEDDLYNRIAKRIGSRMHILKAQLDGLPADAIADLQHEEVVSGLDLYDPADNAGRRSGWGTWWGQEGEPTLWERVKFKMQHKQWLSQGSGTWGSAVAGSWGAVERWEYSKQQSRAMLQMLQARHLDAYHGQEGAVAW